MLEWVRPSAPDLGGYKLKFSPNTDTNIGFNEMGHFLDAISFDTNSVNVPFRIGQYAIKSYDSSGNISSRDVRAISTSPDVIGQDLVFQEFPEDSSWPGTFQNAEIVNGELRLKITGPGSFAEIGYYTYQTVLDLGDIYTARISSYLSDYGLRGFNVMADWPTLVSVPYLNDVQDGDATAYLEVRNSTDQLFISEWVTLSSIPILSTGSVDWTDWRKVFASDHTSQVFQFRIVLERNLNKPDVTPSVTSGRVDVDIRTRIEVGDDIPTIAGPTEIFYNNAFYNTPSMSITPQDLQLGDYWTVTNKNPESFTIEFFDTNDVSVIRTLDFTAVGKGRRAGSIL